jgi:hypothetical protein
MGMLDQLPVAQMIEIENRVAILGLSGLCPNDFLCVVCLSSDMPGSKGRLFAAVLLFFFTDLYK